MRLMLPRGLCSSHTFVVIPRATTRRLHKMSGMDAGLVRTDARPAAATAELHVENLTVRYGSLVALRDMSWQVAGGEILGIIGPNGAGKSSSFAAVTNSVAHSG